MVQEWGPGHTAGNERRCRRCGHGAIAWNGPAVGGASVPGIEKRMVRLFTGRAEMPATVFQLVGRSPQRISLLARMSRDEVPTSTS